jgi:hypothetical protein
MNTIPSSLSKEEILEKRVWEKATASWVIPTVVERISSQGSLYDN